MDSTDSGFDRLFAQEYGGVVSVAFRITGDAAEAEDVAQEVFARLARAGRSNRNGVRNWLYAAAVHTALNAIRARRRRRDREAREYRLETAARSGGERENDPAAFAEQQGDRARLRAALLRINPRDAQILALRYGGLSYREVAAVLEIDVAQIGTRLARAERALKKEIKRETLG